MNRDASAIDPADTKLLAFEMLQAKDDRPIVVESSAFENGQSIPTPYTAYGEDFSPPLKWSNLPAGTQSVVVYMEDPDAAAPKPFVHWLLYNLPAETRQLRASIPQQQGRLNEAGHPEQGKNSRGSIGYFGPRPPVGDPPHHYHFGVYALDKRLDAGIAADATTLQTAMTGHVLAKGVLVGTFAKPTK